MYTLLKSLLFQLSTEQAHRWTMRLFSTLLRIPVIRHVIRRKYRRSNDRLVTSLFGLDFPNPVGLAAGFDKDGMYVRSIEALGFGFMEVGTVTPKAQVGNPRPRLFRLTTDRALINRMGFNNQGLQALKRRLAVLGKRQIVIGGNIGKNKDTPNEKAVDDYLMCFETLFPYVDYFAVNVSSPNTINLRALQEKEALHRILTALQAANQAMASPKPILLKIAPDLSEAQLDDVIDVVQQCRIDGIIATNTTISRAGLSVDAETIDRIGAGGLSGRPLCDRSTEVIRYIQERSGGRIPIIGVGGIDRVEQALEKLRAGAQLIQIYTGLIYNGPNFVSQINDAILSERSKQVSDPAKQS